MIETKGKRLTSNDDSREKAELGKMWQAQADSKFRYYMVSENEIASNPDAIRLINSWILSKIYKENLLKGLLSSKNLQNKEV